MLDYERIRNWDFGEIVSEYRERDLILYALAAGYGGDPTDEAELAFLYEERLRPLPAIATTFGSPGQWWRDPRTGVNYFANLHVDQDLRLLAPIPVHGAAIGRNRVTALHDRGEGRGALAEIERDIVDGATGRLLAVSRRIEVLRESGGFSAASGVSDPRPAPVAEMPDDLGSPALSEEVALSPRIGLLYRLCGDLNPLHVDPAVARGAGFHAPILHGLGSFAVACGVVVRLLCGYDPSRLKRLAVRFVAPVYPGDRLRFEFWTLPDGTARYRARAVNRDTLVLDRGIAEIAPSA